MFKSLRLRFVVALVCVQVALLSVIVWNSLASFRHNYEHSLYDTARNLAAQAAATSARFLFELDTARLGEYVERSMNHEELSFIAVYDVNGTLVASKGPVPPPDSLTPIEGPHDIGVGSLTVAEDVDLNGELLGRVVLGFSLDVMNEALSDARRQSLLLATGLVVLTVIIAFVIGRSLTHDLAMVASGVSRFGSDRRELDRLRASTTEVQSVVSALQMMGRDLEQAVRKQAETARFYQSLIERSSDIVLLLDAEGRISFAGPSVTSVLGYPADALVGRKLSDLAANPLAEDLINARLADRFVSDVLELDLNTSDDEPRTLEVVWQASLDDGGARGFVINGRDVTERHAMQKRIRASEKMEAIGQLTGGVAHDFNNQLAVIMGNLELVEEETDAAARKQALGQAIKACKRSAELTKNLLSFSRKSHLSPQNVDLNSVVRDASSWIQRTIPSTIRFETSLLAGLWRTRIDPNALENALLNLVINARDAMPEGGTLTIETSNMRIDQSYLQSRQEEPLPEGQYVMLAITDTGCGIAPGNLDKIFQPFFTTKAVGSGSGLGLSSVEGFARQSGGTIRVYSEVGNGTTFKLFFPALFAADTVRASAEREATPQNRRRARILVVEDMSDVLDLLRRTLEGAGHEVVVAQNGDIGYETFKASPDFDLLVTDIVMPGEILGTRLAKHLREIRPDLPVIFITGYATEAAMYGNGLRPEDIRLMKPVGRIDLLDAVEKALATPKRT